MLFLLPEDRERTRDKAPALVWVLYETADKCVATALLIIGALFVGIGIPSVKAWENSLNCTLLFLLAMILIFDGVIRRKERKEGERKK